MESLSRSVLFRVLQKYLNSLDIHSIKFTYSGILSGLFTVCVYMLKCLETHFSVLNVGCFDVVSLNIYNIFLAFGLRKRYFCTEESLPCTRIVSGFFLKHLTTLFLLSDNMEACKAESRLKFLPTLEHFFEEAVEQVDPGAGIEEEYKAVNNPNFQWRALRLLAQRSHHFFTPSTTPFKALPQYLSSVIEQLGKEFDKTPGAADVSTGTAAEMKLIDTTKVKTEPTGT